MNNQDKSNNHDQYAKKGFGLSCCGLLDTSETMANCCEGMGGTNDCQTMMQKCMKRFRWCPLIPVIVGILFLLLGYYLDAEITRMMWMAVAGLVILVGIFCFIMMRMCLIKAFHVK